MTFEELWACHQEEMAIRKQLGISAVQAFQWDCDILRKEMAMAKKKKKGKGGYGY